MKILISVITVMLLVGVCGIVYVYLFKNNDEYKEEYDQVDEFGNCFYEDVSTNGITYRVYER